MDCFTAPQASALNACAGLHKASPEPPSDKPKAQIAGLKLQIANATLRPGDSKLQIHDLTF